jgi:alpha-beta hydrolase superfamily lysophospholipase
LTGHSLGGVIALDQALHDVRGLAGLALIAPAISYEATLFEKLLVACMGRLKPDFTVRQSGGAELLTRDAEIQEQLRNDPLRHNMVTPGLGLALMQTTARIIRDAPSLQIPLLLQYGLADEITPPAKLRDFFALAGSTDKQRYEYDGMRHRPFDDLDRELFLADLVSWLDRRKTRTVEH